MKAILNGLISLLLLSLYSLSVAAQDPAYKNYTTSDGLPSINVYSAVQDDEGFMWFSTDNGVSRFDGTKFKNFSIADGLTDNSVSRIIKMKDGKLWFLTFNGKPCYWQNGKIYNSSNSEMLRKLKFASPPNIFFQDSKMNIWLGLEDGNVMRISPSLSIKNFGDIVARDIWEDKNGMIKILTYDKIFTFHDSIPTYNSIEPPGLYYPQVVNLSHDSLLLVVGKDDLVIRNSNGKILNTVSFKKYTHAYVNYLYSDNNKNIWIASKIGAVEFDQGIIAPDHEHTFLSNYSISSVYQDKENNLWFTTLGSGVFMIPSLSVSLIDVKSGLVENNVSDITVINDNLSIIGSQNGSIQFLKNNSVEPANKSDVPPNGNINGIKNDSSGNTWVLTNLVLFKYAKGKFTVLSQLSPWYKSLYIAHNGTIWIGQGRGLSKVEGNEIKRIYYGPINRIYSFAENGSEGLWLGTDKGLYLFKNEKMIEAGVTDSLLRHRINSLAITEDSTLWIATDGYGLLSFKNNIVTCYTIKDHLLSNHCNNLLAEGDKLYLATDNGLNIINTGKKQFNIKSYSAANGLVSNNINRVVRKNEHELLLATDKGIIVFDENKIPAPSVSAPYINEVTVNDRAIQLTELSKLNYDENDISIEFGAINFNSTTNIKYRYRLSGIDKGWNYTSLPFVKYLNLKPGKYVFNASARDAAGNWSQRNASFSFYIETPWWQKWWFRILYILSGVIIIILIIRWRIQVNNRKLNQQKLIAESELKALRVQINPHFIYNSLNSIQDFIMQNQKEDASIYLAKFAKLMRNILAHSITPKITLSQEIESLNLYLELESLRFNNLFTFTFELDERINPEDVQIPSMILQPYVENSILHGLASKEHGGKINISFYKKDDSLVCIIEDNGIGRKKSQEIKQQKAWKNSRSLGMKITQERINLLSIGERRKINLEIIDLADEKDNPSGTRVTLHFPIEIMN